MTAAAKPRGEILGNRASLIEAQRLAREVVIKQAVSYAVIASPHRYIGKSGVRSVGVVDEQYAGGGDGRMAMPASARPSTQFITVIILPSLEAVKTLLT